MRFFVEPWAPEYGASLEADIDAEDVTERADASVEVPLEKWAPIAPRYGAAACAVFVDGVQRIDARVWPAEGDAAGRFAVCVSYAAGTVRCDSAAQVESFQVRRAAFGPRGLGDIDCGAGVRYRGVEVEEAGQAALEKAVRGARELLEIELAHAVSDAEVVIVDGHIHRREIVANAVGYIKSHQAVYLGPDQARIVGALAPGQRTPVFLIDFEGAWPRFSWYLKLPGPGGHPWAGVVRCEVKGYGWQGIGEVGEFADLVCATLPRFASSPHKDPRAPQNLYPVGGLERELRRRMGDQQLLYRALLRTSNS
jgi:hypothetical protein